MKPTHTDTFFTVLTGGFASTVAYLVGGIDNLTNAVAIFMFLDFITGMSSSYYNHGTIDSTRAYRGIMKKSGMIAFVIVANQLDIVTGNGDGFLRDAMMMTIIGIEGISIGENARKMGFEPPQALKEMLYRMAGKDPNQK